MFEALYEGGQKGLSCPLDNICTGKENILVFSSSTLPKSNNPFKVSYSWEERKRAYSANPQKNRALGPCSGIISTDHGKKWRNALVIGKKAFRVYRSHWTIFIVKNLNILASSKHWHEKIQFRINAVSEHLDKIIASGMQRGISCSTVAACQDYIIQLCVFSFIISNE